MGDIFDCRSLKSFNVRFRASDALNRTTFSRQGLWEYARYRWIVCPFYLPDDVSLSDYLEVNPSGQYA